MTIICGDKYLKVTENGNFYNYFGIDAEFYILDDNDQSAVVTASGLDKIMSLGKNSSIVGELLSVQCIRKGIESKLIKKSENPIIFQYEYSNGISDTFSVDRGFDIKIIIDICKAILSARNSGYLPKNKIKTAKKEA
ncbi:hypothetical protein BBD39_08035 [Arsenophonus endosymbiont of Bemisia tabaci Asia II 3]|nr:hypothetical protein BBD39_08035 [Arsenophonus endosymbiont of Bemisia tabaci Asia II 3]